MMTDWFRGRPKRGVAAVALSLGLGALAAMGADRLLNPPATFKFANPEEPASRASFSPIVKRVLPSVVTVTSSRMVKTDFNQGDENAIPPMFRQFFGHDDDENGGGGRQFRMPRQQKERGLGSGVIVSPNGYILTN